MYLLLLPALCSLSLSTLTLAAEPKASKQKLNLAPPAITAGDAGSITVKESFVSVDGIKYKRLEIGNDTFFLRLREPERENPATGPRTPDETARCKRRPLLDQSDRAMLVGEVKITQKTKAYVQGLYRDCEDHEVLLKDLRAGVKHQLTPKADLRLEFNHGPTTSPYGKTLESKFNLDF